MLTHRRRFASVMSSRTQMQAMALAGALNSVIVVEPTPFHLRSTAPIYRRLPAQQQPLDLTATVFRYLRREDGSIEPMRTYAATLCRCKSRITQRGR
jgi:hypothetical protein